MEVRLVIKIPEKEFGIDIDDKFQDFFKRLKAEIKEQLISGTALVCGAYELETIEMFLNAFANATPLPKGYWREVDTNEYACSNCNHTFSIVPGDNSIEEYMYCPNCITKMVKMQKGVRKKDDKKKM